MVVLVSLLVVAMVVVRRLLAAVVVVAWRRLGEFFEGLERAPQKITIVHRILGLNAHASALLHNGVVDYALRKLRRTASRSPPPFERHAWIVAGGGCRQPLAAVAVAASAATTASEFPSCRDGRLRSRGG